MRFRTRWTLAILMVVAMPVAIAIAGLPIYVFPAQGSIDKADILFILGPATGPRLAQAEKLKQAGIVGTTLISAFPRPDRALTDIEYCRRPDTVCETPSPATTKGEIAMLQSYAIEHDTKRAIILTSMSHVERTRYILDKCYSASEATVIGVEERKSLWRWTQEYIYQSAAFVKAWATPCSDL